MASFKFIRRDTGETEQLAFVDDTICAYVGGIPSPDHACPWYDMLVEVGFAMLMREGGDTITPRMVHKMLEYWNTKGANKLTPFQCRTIRWAFCHQWEFQAWR